MNDIAIYIYSRFVLIHLKYFTFHLPKAAPPPATHTYIQPPWAGAFFFKKNQ